MPDEDFRVPEEGLGTEPAGSAIGPGNFPAEPENPAAEWRRLLDEVFSSALSQNPPPESQNPSRDTAIPYPWPPVLSDREWAGLSGLYARPSRPRLRRLRKGGRPRADDRRCFEALIWLMATGANLRELPGKLGRRSTVARWIDRQGRAGLLERGWWLYLDYLPRRELEQWRRAPEPGHHRSGFWRGQLYALTRVMARACP